MTIFDDFRDAAVDIINTFPKTATLRDKAANSDYDPATGIVTHTPTEYTATIAMPFNFDRRFVDNDVIQAEDVQTYVAAKDLGYEPSVGWEVEYDSKTWHVVSVERLPDGSTSEIAAYGLQLRRG